MQGPHNDTQVDKDLRTLVFGMFKERSGQNKKAKKENVGSAGGKGTPIIIVPNAHSSLLTLYNAKAFLEEGIYIPSQEARMKAAEGGGAKPAKIEIRRKDNRGIVCK